MNLVNKSDGSRGAEPSPNGSVWIRSIALFANFFLIILAYYQVKAASRTILQEFGGTEIFPYVWILSAVTLILLLSVYQRAVSRFPRVGVVLSSLALFAGLLCLFRLLSPNFDLVSALAFYVFVDIFSVVLVEQFWSLTNSVSTVGQGKKTFWFVGTGGLLGGLVGGKLVSYLVGNGIITTPDLLFVCAGTLLATLILNVSMWLLGVYNEVPREFDIVDSEGGWRALASNPYLLLIAALLCLSQIAQPVVEYQFLSLIENTYKTTDERTAFLGEFFGYLGIAAIGINVLVTPIIHRYLGIFAGLAVQPVMLAFGAFGFFLYPSLAVAAGMKIADRGLSYSINRASKEQLYIPVDAESTYLAKAWIDMLGYRLFKVLGSGLILFATSWLPFKLSVPELSIITFAVTLVWLYVIALVARHYHREVSPVT
ncbi:MAG: Npt1/Npt2 family nucleotide transporter [Pseudomonadota bacterium]